jgi:Exostosin family
MKIKIFSSRDWLKADSHYHFILYPFWGIDRKYEKDRESQRFEKFIKNAHNYFELTSIPEDADYLVYPIDYGSVKKSDGSFAKANALAKNFKKKLIVFYFSDFDEPLELENCIVFRNSLDGRTRKVYEYAAPAMVEDFSRFINLEKNVVKSLKPSIGFCGYIDFENTKDWITSIPHRIKNILKDTFFRRHFYEAESIRGKAIRTLLRSRDINLTFIKRSGYWGKWATQTKVINDTFQEYLQVMEDTDYHLVARGNGNFSIRFSEVLSAGRIPVFINSHCVLPYEDIIDWKNTLVWIEEEELHIIDQKLIDFHKNITETEFLQRKRQMKFLFEEYISPDGFFKNLWRVLL